MFRTVIFNWKPGFRKPLIWSGKKYFKKSIAQAELKETYPFSQITRRLMHRPILVYRQPNILCIDGIPVTNDERAKAEVYLMDHQVQYWTLCIRVRKITIPKIILKI